jgi:predicted MFS family arabinose efflux permease
LPLLVLALTGSGLAMGVVGALQTLPDLFLAMLAGALADRSDRKRMMLLADLGRAALTALIPISVLLGGPTMGVILLVAAPMSMLRAFFLAGYTASVPALVGRAQVGRANSYFEAIYSVGFILGPAIAGILATTIGPGPTLAIDAVSFALSGLGLLFVRRDLRAPIDRPRERLLTEIREGIDYILGHQTLRVVILFWGLVSITIDLALPASALGIVLTAFGGGTITGALIMSRVGQQRPAPLLIGGTVGTGSMLLLIATDSPVPILMAAAFGFGVAQSVVLLTYITLRTNLSPDELLGRIGSTARTISLGLQPIGLIVGGIVIDSTSGSTALIVMGLGELLICAVFACIPAMRRASATVGRP